MKFLHTSDWHVGKTIRGLSRADEHREVLAEIAGIASDHEVDLILVAGDLYETAAPGPESEQIVYRALLDLARVAPVLVVAGNHDNPRRLEAVAPLLEIGSVRVITAPTRPSDGGLVELDVGATKVKVAMLPFVSQRSIVKADQLMADEAYEHSQDYAERMTRILEHLTDDFDGDSVNLICAHLFAANGTLGGGERTAHTIFEYSVPGQAFPPTTSYVALGHLHRTQEIKAGAPVHYCGSPLQLDFGEENDIKHVNVVEAEPGKRAKVESIPLTGGRRLATHAGTLAELRTIAENDDGSAWLRVRVHESARSGLAAEVRELFGESVVDVTIESPDAERRTARTSRKGLSPIELFDAYCGEQNIDDTDVRGAFIDLLEVHQR